ncbi:MAG TPA: Ig-like domain-containing protein [Vicinamibacterales bacterium]|nr:Ig-like domain-containing protein [Vicinamibacterales bacterium]
MKRLMIRICSVASAIVAAVLVAGAGNDVGARQAPQSRQTPPTGHYAANELLVQYSPAMNTLARDAAINLQRATRLRRFARLNIDHVRVPSNMSMQDALAAFRAIPGVASVQPNYIRRAIQSPSAPPNDPSWLDGSLWGLQKIQAQQAWTNFTTGNGSVIVASIDTGVDYTHPDLAPNMWRNPLEIPGNGIDDDGDGYVDDVYGIDTVNHDSNPFDDQGHGTHTSGTIAAAGNNGLGVVGVNWNAKILACKFLSAEGSGTDAGAIECFDYITALRARGENIRVSSNSWGGSRSSEPVSQALKAAIDAAGALGIINIFGAGNDGTNNDVSPFDPASYDSDSIVAVASSGTTDRPSFFSNYGATSVDLEAPGENILSTYPGGDYEYLSGTSMATPHVAGVAALLVALDPTLTVPAIKQLLLDNVDQTQRWANKVLSGGRLNAWRAAAAVGASPNTPPQVAITAPFDGVSYKAPAMVALEAAASDEDGTVQQVAFYANGALIGIDTTSPYAVTWNAALPGSYLVTAIATDDRFGTSTAAIHVTMLANAPPAVSLTAPAENSSFTSPASVTIDATASDPDGGVQQVAFYANGIAIGVDTSSPYSLTWAPALGTYTLTAIATDNQGATTTSAAVHIVVDPIPGRINVAAAANGGTAIASSVLSPSYPASGTINGDRKGLNWGAGGGWNDGTQNAGPDWLEVDFRGIKLIEEVNVFSMQDNYTAPLDPTPAMTFSYWGLKGFEVQYWDGVEWVGVPNGVVANNTLVWRKVVFAPIATSKVRIWITAAQNGYARMMEAEAWGISSGINAPPDVAITGPAEGASFSAPPSVTVAANASDSDGVVQQVAFFANGAPIGVDTSSPFTAVWSAPAPGNYTLTAVATDDSGATTTSPPVHVVVKPPNVPPSVSITSPAPGDSIITPVTVGVAASASDGDGSIASVRFYANGALLGTSTAAPYSVNWINPVAGSYELTAVATDNEGATTTSAPVAVTIAQSPTRQNVALASNGAVALASSILGANYGPSGAINGDRKGLNWGNGGGWNDATPYAGPDWIEVDFAGARTIDEINVFSMQDAYTAPVQPTLTMTFGYWGLRAFEVQYWNGTSWVAVPNGAVAGNDKVWRQFLFAPITTTKIRVWVTGALNGYARVIEVEAWGQ